MRPEDSAVDNAANVDDPYDTHPCGPGPTLGHDPKGDVCEDCGHRHDWWHGECHECGARHNEDCVGCAAFTVDPSHLYEGPEETEPQAEEPDGMGLAKIAIEDRLMGLE